MVYNYHHIASLCHTTLHHCIPNHSTPTRHLGPLLHATLTLINYPSLHWKLSIILQALSGQKSTTCCHQPITVINFECEYIEGRHEHLQVLLKRNHACITISWSRASKPPGIPIGLSSKALKNNPSFAKGQPVKRKEHWHKSLPVYLSRDIRVLFIFLRWASLSPLFALSAAVLRISLSHCFTLHSSSLSRLHFPTDSTLFSKYITFYDVSNSWPLRWAK